MKRGREGGKKRGRKEGKKERKKCFELTTSDISKEK
jgi:hypothetical protein